MSYELIICEKPSAAEKIATALADSKPVKKSENGVPYYLIAHHKKDIVVACAVGHLYTVAEKEKKVWTYPVFDVEWKATSEIDKKADYSEKYLKTIKKLAKDAKEFTIACDYDIEGETIGYNILIYACKQKDGRRMKFSTLTKDELVESYEHANPHLDWGQAHAGTTRHVLDYYYGINLSRALSLAVRAAGAFKVLSAGRVQGPTLKTIVDREKEIKAFKPEPFWQIELKGNSEKNKSQKEPDLIALHIKDKFWKKDEADTIFKKVTQHKDKANIKSIERTQFKQAPPTPLDLTTLQTEAYRSMRIQPKDALSVAQELYLKGLITYPRTSSQQLPKSIGYANILKQITRQQMYQALAEKLLKKSSLEPNNGKKTDPAHHAIFPTGQHQHLDGYEAKIYYLIMRRFLATFADPALRETMTITVDITNEDFIAKGTRTIEKGWHEFYGPHVKLEEIELPQVAKGERVHVKSIDLLNKETQPPKRYTPASIIKELEKRGLGTKATRAQIVESLYARGYVKDTALQATELGIKTCEILEKYCPEIVDEALTRQFEEKLDEIREKKTKGETVLAEAEQVLTKLLKAFKQKEKIVGKELLEANVETRHEENFVGKCMKCEQGELMIRPGKFGRFIACNKYPACKTTFSIPSKGFVKPAKKACETCQYPMIEIKQAKRGPREMCINHDCKSKALSKEEQTEAKKEEKPCPKCIEEKRTGGRLVVRKGMYGAFLGCSNYPKCKQIQRLESKEKQDGKQQEKKEPKKAGKEKDKKSKKTINKK